jgi:hypothetical protein
MNRLVVLTLFVILSACHSGKEKAAATTEILMLDERGELPEEQDDFYDPYDENGYFKHPDTLLVDYATYKDMYDILLALPKLSDTFKWTVSERKDYVRFIREHNYTINRSDFLKTLPPRPNKLYFGINNGFFTLTAYPVGQGNSLVISYDVDGESGEVIAYLYQDGVIQPLDKDTILEAPQPLLLLNSEDMTCGGLLDEDFSYGIGFEYDFSEELTISNTWYLKEEEMKDCLKGNTLKFRFNPQTYKFELTGISFEKYKEYYER